MFVEAYEGLVNDAGASGSASGKQLNQLLSDTTDNFLKTIAAGETQGSHCSSLATARNSVSITLLKLCSW